MFSKQQLEYVDETDEMDVPSLPWLEEAQLRIYEETKNLSPQESEEHWSKKRTEWQLTRLRMAPIDGAKQGKSASNGKRIFLINEINK